MLVGGGEVCAGNVGSAVCHCVDGCVVELDGEAAWWRRYSWIPYFFCLGAVGEEPPISLALGTVDNGGVVGGRRRSRRHRRVVDRLPGIA